MIAWMDQDLKQGIQPCFLVFTIQTIQRNQDRTSGLAFEPSFLK